jgi:hypothetical protein
VTEAGKEKAASVFMKRPVDCVFRMQQSRSNDNQKDGGGVEPLQGIDYSDRKDRLFPDIGDLYNTFCSFNTTPMTRSATLNPDSLFFFASCPRA